MVVKALQLHFYNSTNSHVLLSYILFFIQSFDRNAVVTFQTINSSLFPRLIHFANIVKLRLKIHFNGIFKIDANGILKLSINLQNNAYILNSLLGLYITGCCFIF